MRNAKIRCKAAHYLCLACGMEICSRGHGPCAQCANGKHGPITLLRSIEEQERARTCPTGADVTNRRASDDPTSD